MSSFQTPLSTQAEPTQRQADAHSVSMSGVPAQLWQTLANQRHAKKLPKGLDAAYDQFTAWWVPLKPRKRLSLKAADKVLALADSVRTQTDTELKANLLLMRERFRRGREAKTDTIEALALVREAAKRTMGMEPYPVQVAAGYALTNRCLVEMATGEGKSLVATLPAIIAGWRGRGCHVMTVNDYLAGRDAEHFRKLYKWCGLTVGHVDGSMQGMARKSGYQADITYLTNKEAAADFLRDKLAMGRTRGLTPALLEKLENDFQLPGFQPRGGPEQMVMRGLEVAIIDEADSILVDEAVTPLIISTASQDKAQQAAYPVAAEMAAKLEPGDFAVNVKYREVDLTKQGKAKIETWSQQLEGPAAKLFAGPRIREEFVTQALSALHLFLKGQQYVVLEGKVVIVDEATGRLMPDRSWRAGLHQAVEAKEKLEVSAVKETMARISFQRFFRLYRHLCGMSGTLLETRAELWQIYKTPTVPIPTHRPRIRVDQPMRIEPTQEAKWHAVADEVARVHQTGRPVLVGTRSVSDSETLAALLAERGLEHQVLNAVHHEQEADIVADAGQRGKITVATNMAGRGTDIKLGDGVAELGGLCVIATDRHESKRVDRQLMGRAGRQGDPGSSVFIVASDDELVRRHNKGRGQSKAHFDKAQARSGRLARVMRKGVLRNDDWLDDNLGFAGREH